MTDMSLGEDTAHPLALYRNHMEFNGYRVEEGEETLFCHHPRKPNLILKPIGDRGVLVSAIYSCADGIARINALEYVNDLNRDFLFMKAFIDTDHDLILETFFEGDYDRTNFSILLENIEYDMNILRRNELTERFLR